MAEPTFNMTPSDLAIHGTYFPLRFRIGPVSKERVRAIAAYILNTYSRKRLSYTQWRAVGDITISWADGNQVAQESRSFRFEHLCSHLRDKEAFEPAEWNLPAIRSDWLDASLEIKQPFCAPQNEDHNEALTFMLASPLSDAFPVQPKIDREGRAFSSLQVMLLQSWFELRTRLVVRSDQFFEGHDWLRDLFMYLNTVVSAVDNTLHQIYYRAKYHPTPGWTFDEKRLGPPAGRRLLDKLAWVG
jgi:hypothetical protein